MVLGHGVTASRPRDDRVQEGFAPEEVACELRTLLALGGGVTGCLVGMAVAAAIVAITNASNYFMAALGWVGAVIGMVAGMSRYGQSAPVG